MKAGPKGEAHGDIVSRDVPMQREASLPDTIPRDAESQDCVTKHPGRVSLFSLNFSCLSGAVGAGSRIPMAMGK